MGYVLKKADYKVRVKTDNLVGSGTDADVHIILYNESGQASRTTELTKLGNDFERGDTDSFAIYDMPNFGPVARIEIWRDSWLDDSWYVDYIEVEDKSHRMKYPFPIQRWITRRHLVIDKYDSSLPQDSSQPEQMRLELDRELNKYQFVTLNEGLPPVNMQFWDKDWYFGAQRLMGCNAAQIKLCTEIPSKFGVTNELVDGLLDNMSLDEALSNEQLFIVDHKILDGITSTKLNDQMVLCAPIALFFVNKEEQLVPVAIQLFQEKGVDNPLGVYSCVYVMCVFANRS
ncbi:polyunsaturated fatty acid 5-lipoxygenase-like [Saccoglossus kowalevskii]